MSTTTPEAVQPGTYNIDPSHSNVGFEVRHMGIATVRGKFKKFAGTVEAADGKLTREVFTPAANRPRK